MNKPMHEHTLRNKHTWNCNQYFSSGAFCVGKHVSNVINHRDKCMVMVCLSATAKQHENFRFVSTYLRKHATILQSL